MTREVRLGIAVLAALGAFVFFLLVVGNPSEPRPDVVPLTVEEVLGGSGPPVERYGDGELRVVGWYAELDADCRGESGGVDPSVAWLQRDCPLRVLLPEQPADDVTQAELERDGLRLAAPVGAPFPSRAAPGGANLRFQRLVFEGHFGDRAATSCVPERLERCRNTLVVSDYDEYVR